MLRELEAGAPRGWSNWIACPQLGVYDGLAHERHLFQATPDAIAHARLHAARIVHA